MGFGANQMIGGLNIEHVELKKCLKSAECLQPQKRALCFVQNKNGIWILEDICKKESCYEKNERDDGWQMGNSWSFI